MLSRVCRIFAVAGGLSIFLGASCTPPILTPPPPPAYTVVFPIRGADGAFLETADGVLQPDLHTAVDCPNMTGQLICVLAGQSGGANMVITAPGYQTQNFRLVIPQENTTWAEIQMQPVSVAPSRLRVQGKRMLKDDGTVFAWQGITAFSLVNDLADGRDNQVITLLDWAAANGVTIVRVLSQLPRGMFELTPETGRMHLPRLLVLAAERGLYVEVVGLAGTGIVTFDHRQHLTQIGQICAHATNCVIEIANEPNHASQAVQVRDPKYLLELRKLIPAHVMVSLGAAHGPSDESMDYTGGDYVTVHTNRSNADDGWKWVQHAREVQAMRDAHHQKFAVSDEPRRDFPREDQHLAYGLLMRMYGLGDTFHYLGGLHGQIPVGDELVGFLAHQRAWQIVTDDWSTGQYTAAHLTNSPVRVNDQVLRAYSSLQGSTGLTLLMNVRAGAVVTWQHGWAPALVVTQGKTQFYRVTR